MPRGFRSGSPPPPRNTCGRCVRPQYDIHLPVETRDDYGRYTVFDIPVRKAGRWLLIDKGEIVLCPIINTFHS